MTFAEKIVRLRKLKGLTQDEFASAVGVSRQAVYKWESGQSYPEVSKLLEIKLLFNISIDDLLDESYVVVLPEKKRKKRISKEAKKEIEAKVESEMFIEEPAVVTVEEEVIAAEEPAEAQTEIPAVPEEKAVAAPENKEEMTIEDNPPATEKKKGFFGRLFGRK